MAWTGGLSSMRKAPGSRICFRFDASASVGRGHMQRCASLAAALRNRGMTIGGAVCRGEGIPGAMDSAGPYSSMTCLPEDGLDRSMDAELTVAICRKEQTNVLVLDSYRVDESYQRFLRQHGIRWLQFDTFANRPMHADWVLNASPDADHLRYAVLQSRTDTQLLIGPRYAVLHPSYWDARAQRHLRHSVRRIVVCLGGGDDRGVMPRLLESLRGVLNFAERWDVVVGGASASLESIKYLLGQPPYSTCMSLHVDTPHAAQLFQSADLGILTGGTVSYEAAAMGLPMLLLTIADNQTGNMRGWARLDAGIACGAAHDRASLDALAQSIAALASDPVRLKRMSSAAMEQTDGRGALRVANAMIERLAA